MYRSYKSQVSSRLRVGKSPGCLYPTFGVLITVCVVIKFYTFFPVLSIFAVILSPILGAGHGRENISFIYISYYTDGSNSEGRTELM